MIYGPDSNNFYNDIIDLYIGSKHGNINVEDMAHSSYKLKI